MKKRSNQLSFDLSQLEPLAAAPPDLSADRPWTYHFGMPDRSGTSVYTHLIQAPRFDPKPTMKHGSKERDPLHWKKANKDPEHFAKLIDALFDDGKPRTFNGISIELTGTEASVWLHSALDEGLWLLVARERLAWANEEEAVFFLRADYIERHRV